MTAEAEETLETVEKGVIYIIGGIVDRNRMPGICDNRAKELGITRKRLPIKENITVSWKDQLETSLANITSKPHFDYDLPFSFNPCWTYLETESKTQECFLETKSKNENLNVVRILFPDNALNDYPNFWILFPGFTDELLSRYVSKYK